MIEYMPSRPPVNLKSLLGTLRLSAAFTGPFALALLALPHAAIADDECGVAPAVAGTVTCTPAGNIYPDGITYIAPIASLTVVLQNGVVVNTSGGLNIGVLVLGTDDVAMTVLGGTNTSVTTDAPGAFGVLGATTNGALALTLDRIVTSGEFATGIIASSSEGLTTVNVNSITTTGDGADGISATTDIGNIVIDAGTITVAGLGARGIEALSDAGDIGIVVDAIATGSGSTAFSSPSANGIIAVTGGSGTVDIDAATVTTSDDNAIGLRAETFEGAARVTVGGVSTSGANADGLSIESTLGDASVDIGGAVRTTGLSSDAVVVSAGRNATIDVRAGGSIAGGGNFITITSGERSVVNHAGTIGEAVNGSAILALGGPVAIVNTGTLSSDIVLTANADSIANSGIFDVMSNPDFGAGTDAFTNSGTVFVGRGALAPVAPAFIGLESFSNSGGLIDMRNGRPGDTLTLSGAFNGTGASRLGLDVRQGSAPAGDRLTLAGAATGSTQLLLAQGAGSQPGFGSGPVVVQAGAASNPNAFALPGGAIESGFVRTEIAYNPADFSFRLVGTVSDAALRTLGYVEGARTIWQQSADTVSAHLRAQRDEGASSAEPDARIWVQVYGSAETRDGQRDFNASPQPRITEIGFKQDYFGGQIGVDFGADASAQDGLTFGLSAGYVQGTQDFARSVDRLEHDAYNVGAYGVFRDGAFFAHGIVKYDFTSSDAVSPAAGLNQTIDGHSYGARGEVGYRFGTDAFFVEPSASITYVKTTLDGFSVGPTSVEFDDDSGLQGRFGARIGGQIDLDGLAASYYAGGNYVREFNGKDGVVFSNAGQTLAFRNLRPQDYGEAFAGVNFGESEGLAGFVEATYSHSFDDETGRLAMDGVGARAGVRVRY
jgi:trimeric autotransporter adhesin